MDAYSKYLSNALNKYKIHVSSYHGNAGDELIIKATFKIIKNLDNNFINANCNEADIILIPGGNFSMWQIFYNKIYDYITNYNAKLIIGPSTFHGNFTDWRNLLINNTSRFEALFPRDKISNDSHGELLIILDGEEKNKYKGGYLVEKKKDSVTRTLIHRRPITDVDDILTTEYVIRNYGGFEYPGFEIRISSGGTGCGSFVLCGDDITYFGKSFID